MLKLSELIKNSSVIAIAGHVNPDGDCVGSCLGLYNYLKQISPYKEIHIYLEHLSGIYDYIFGCDQVEFCQNNDNFDLIFILDCGDMKRVGVIKESSLTNTDIICIDHHISNKGFGKIDIIYPYASSTSEIIYELITADNGQVTADIAASLYSGIVQDTGVFKYSCTGKRTMEIAGELMDTGIDYPWIIDRIFYEKTYEHQRILSVALSRAIYRDSVISSYVDLDDMDICGASFEDLEGIVNDLLNTRGAEASIFVHPKKNDMMKVSLRSKKSVNVCNVAVQFGGGGHIQAAGFDTSKAPADIIKELRTEINKQII